MRMGFALLAALATFGSADYGQAEPRENRSETRVRFGAPEYARTSATVPLRLELDEHAKRFVGLAITVTEVHPIRPNENIPPLIPPYEMPLPAGRAVSTEISFPVRHDAKYRIEVKMVYLDFKDELVHRIDKEEIHGERK